MDRTDIAPQFYKRWAEIYVQYYVDNKKGPQEAKAWAFRLKLTGPLIRALKPYIHEEFKKRGFTPTTNKGT